jgi:hypothetical protein
MDGVNAADIQVGFQRLASLSSATPLTVPTDARFAVITIEAQPVRIRTDNTAPTTTIGHLLNPSDSVTLRMNQDLSKVQLIETVSGAVAQISYWK